MIERMREKIVSELYKLPSLQASWPIWLEAIRSGVSNVSSPDDVLNIADRLRQVFRETKGSPSQSAAEEQSASSVGGTAWEALVCWYLNLCLIGTSSLVVKRRSQVEGPISWAIATRYNNVSVNSEADLLGITFPPTEPFVGTPATSATGWLKKVNKALANGGVSDTALAVIQCKTTWNDNAQVPMLWDLIYQPESQIGGKVSVGVKGYSPKSFASFRYAFVTVPTVGTAFKSTSVAVLRVNALSGGNYWGRKSQPGVAMSLSEIFPKARIGPNGGGGVREGLLKALPSLHSKYAYFGL